MTPPTEGRLARMLAAHLARVDGRPTLAEMGVAVQLTVARPPRRWSVALGIDAWGVPATPATRHNVYCAAKPMLWALLLRALDDAGLDPAAGVRRLVGRPDWAWVPNVDVATLLRHDAGLGAPDALTWRLTEPGERPGLLERTVWPGPAAHYSEVVAGLVAERVIEVLNGWASTGEAVDRVVLPTWGLTHSRATVAPGEVAAAQAGLSVPVGLSTGRRVPFLSEVQAPSPAEVGPSTGCLTTADDLCRFYELALGVLGGGQVDHMPLPATARRAWTGPATPRNDGVLRRPAAFTGGMMRDLDARVRAGGDGDGDGRDRWR